MCSARSSHTGAAFCGLRRRLRPLAGFAPISREPTAFVCFGARDGRAGLAHSVAAITNRRSSLTNAVLDLLEHACCGSCGLGCVTELALPPI